MQVRRTNALAPVTRRIWHAALAVLLFVVCASWLTAGYQAPERQHEPRPTSKPYTGDLSIFDSPGRDERLQVNKVMDILGISPGKNVADVGAGSGWFTVRAARRTTERGTVYAVDINPEAIHYIQRRLERENLRNVKTIVSRPDDPLLPRSSVDCALLLKTYHEISRPVDLLRNLQTALKPGARVGIIDRNGNGENHGVMKDIVIREAAEAGYRLVEEHNFVKGDNMDYFLVFVAAQ